MPRQRKKWAAGVLEDAPDESIVMPDFTKLARLPQGTPECPKARAAPYVPTEPFLDRPSRRMFAFCKDCLPAGAKTKKGTPYKAKSLPSASFRALIKRAEAEQEWLQAVGEYALASTWHDHIVRAEADISYRRVQRTHEYLQRMRSMEEGMTFMEDHLQPRASSSEAPSASSSSLWPSGSLHTHSHSSGSPESPVAAPMCIDLSDDEAIEVDNGSDEELPTSQASDPLATTLTPAELQSHMDWFCRFGESRWVPILWLLEEANVTPEVLTIALSQVPHIHICASHVIVHQGPLCEPPVLGYRINRLQGLTSSVFHVAKELTSPTMVAVPLPVLRDVAMLVLDINTNQWAFALDSLIQATWIQQVDEYRHGVPLLRVSYRSSDREFAENLCKQFLSRVR